MSRTVEYHCLSCHDHTVTRGFDVSHISLTCESCGEFGRFINGRVLGKFEEFEESPPDDLDWERLDRMEKFVVAEGITRRGRSLDDFDIETHEEPSTDDTADDDPSTDNTANDDSSTDETADGESAGDVSNGDRPTEGASENGAAGQ